MVHAGCDFVAGIHPSRTWTPGSFESVLWNAHVHRLDLGLLSSESVFLNGVRAHVNSKGKIPSTGKIIPRGGSNQGHCIKQDSEPNTLPLSYSAPARPQKRRKKKLRLKSLFDQIIGSRGGAGRGESISLLWYFVPASKDRKKGRKKEPRKSE